MDEVKRLFFLRQKQLIAFANSKQGRAFFQLEQFGNKVVRVGTNCIVTDIGKGKLRGKFWVGNNMVAKLIKLGKTPIVHSDIAQTAIDLIHIKEYGGLNYRFTNYNTGTGDGQVNNLDTVFSDGRNATDGTAADDSSTANLTRCEFATPNYNFARLFMPSDTSGIAGGTVTAASFNGYVNLKADADTTEILLVPTTQASVSALTTADFDAVTFSSIGTKTIDSLTTSAYNEWTITDLTKISTSGYTQIGLLTKVDYDNSSAPTGDNFMQINSANAASNKPYYDVTFTALAGNKSYSFFM